MAIEATANVKTNNAATPPVVSGHAEAQLKDAKGDIKDAASSTAEAGKKAGSAAVETGKNVGNRATRFVKDTYAKVPTVKVPGNPFTAQGRAELKAAPRVAITNLGTPHNHASNRSIAGCLLGAATCVAGFAGLVYKDLAIELFKGILLHDALLMAAVVLSAVALVKGVIRLFSLTTATPVVPSESVSSKASVDVADDQAVLAELDKEDAEIRNNAKNGIDRLHTIGTERAALVQKLADQKAAAAASALATAAADADKKATEAKGEAAAAKGETAAVKGELEAKDGVIAGKEAEVETAQNAAKDSATVAAEAQAKLDAKVLDEKALAEAAKKNAEAGELIEQVGNDDKEINLEAGAGASA